MLNCANKITYYAYNKHRIIIYAKTKVDNEYERNRKLEKNTFGDVCGFFELFLKTEIKK